MSAGCRRERAEQDGGGSLQQESAAFYQSCMPLETERDCAFKGQLWEKWSKER